MRRGLQNSLNNHYMRMIRTLGKWSLLLGVAAMLGTGISVKFIVPKVHDAATDGKGVVIKRDTDDNAITLYEDEKVPSGYEDELDTDAPQLIYQNQVRASEGEGGQHEDGRQDLVSVSRSERRQLERITSRFLRRWQTFEVGQSDRAYTDALRPMVDLSRLDRVTRRLDDMEDPAVGRNGQTGARLETYAPVGDPMKILRYDGRTAYVSTVGEVSYTGPALTWANKKVRRAYALVLTRYRDGWKVSRAAAQTQGEIIE